MYLGLVSPHGVLVRPQSRLHSPGQEQGTVLQGQALCLSGLLTVLQRSPTHTTAARCQVSSLWRSSVPLIAFYFNCYCFFFFFQNNNRCIKLSNISGLIMKKKCSFSAIHLLLSFTSIFLSPGFIIIYNSIIIWILSIFYEGRWT